MTTALFADTTAEQAYEAKPSRPLRLPPEQPRFVHPEPPGKRPDGKLWFDGPLKRKSDAVDEHSVKRALTSYGDELKPRDYRQGDRWLPWHFLPDGSKRP